MNTSGRDPRATDFRLSVQDGSYLLQWECPEAGGELRVFRGEHAEGRELSAAPLGAGSVVLEGPALPDPSTHPVFTVVLDSDAYEDAVLRVAQRRLPVDGASNFRDFGGYLTAEGRQVRWGKLFRSGQLAGLQDADRAVISNVAITAVCDFRRHDELERSPSRLPAAAVSHHMPISPGNTRAFFEQFSVMNENSNESAVDGFMEEINRELVREHAAPYRHMFDHLLHGNPVLIHCSAGKDRTGFGAALVLAALGVDSAHQMNDYRRCACGQ